jgi:hypothetical protein
MNSVTNHELRRNAEGPQLTTEEVGLKDGSPIASLLLPPRSLVMFTGMVR